VTVDEFRRLVARLSYKPGWEVSVLQGPVDGSVTLRVAFTVSDARAVRLMAPALPLRIKHPLSASLLAGMNEARAVAFVFEKVLEMERHEAREWFKLDGIPVDYPHEPNGDLR